ncbi:DUF721 domain-containing protein [bacterium]|nr:DUF721 domain-containing protein [bacterium]
MALNRLLKRHKIAQAINQYRSIEIWSDVVGETIASKSQPKSIDRGKLFVAVTSSVWRNELMYHKEMILAKLNDRLGKNTIKDIIFQ